MTISVMVWLSIQMVKMQVMYIKKVRNVKMVTVNVAITDVAKDNIV